MKTPLRVSLDLVALLALISIGAFAAGPYAIGPGDVLLVSVWERPDLTRTVTVRTGGQIIFPPLGEVSAAGKSPAELGRFLEERLTDYLRRPTQVSVDVAEFLSRRITVSGAVASPGRLSFEEIPGLVDVLGAAGGLGPEAALGGVQIFRWTNGQRSAISVDIAEAMRTGDFSGLPELLPDDVVFVPSTGAEAGAGSNAAFITGDVAQPGAYGVGSGIDLLKLISISGGSLPTGDLSRVQIVGTDPGGETFTASVDLEKYLETGDARFLVRPGDVIRVPPRRHSAPGAIWAVTREFLGLSRDIINLFLIFDVLRDE